MDQLRRGNNRGMRGGPKPGMSVQIRVSEDTPAV
jgi:hypothetical protein